MTTVPWPPPANRINSVAASSYGTGADPRPPRSGRTSLNTPASATSAVIVSLASHSTRLNLCGPRSAMAPVLHPGHSGNCGSLRKPIRETACK